jgi:hypothetical protein
LDSKIDFGGKSSTIAVTSKWADPFLSCCVAYAARLHSQEAVGEDLDVVFRFSGGTPRAGTYSLGDASSSVSATLRSSVPRPDAGTVAQAQVKGGLIVVGTPESGKQAWQMGACAEVTDSSSPWQGLRIYLPGVEVAPFEWASRFRMWRLKDPSLRGTDVDRSDINTLELASEPLLDLMDLDFVELESTRCSFERCMWMGLNPGFTSASTLLGNVKGTATSIDLRGVPFVVEADGERIYLGAFQTVISSIGVRGPVVMVEEVTNEGFPLYPPPNFQPPPPDLRSDPRIVKVFTEAGKLIP